MSSASVTRFAGRSGAPNRRAERQLAVAIPLTALGVGAFNLLVMARGGLGGVELVLSVIAVGGLMLLVRRAVAKRPAEVCIDEGAVRLVTGRGSRSLRLASAGVCRKKWVSPHAGALGEAVVVHDASRSLCIAAERALAPETSARDSVEAVDVVLELDELDELEAVLIRHGARAALPAPSEAYRRAGASGEQKIELVANPSSGQRTTRSVVLWVATMLVAIGAGQLVYASGAGAALGAFVALAVIAFGMFVLARIGAKQAPRARLVIGDDEVVLLDPNSTRELARARPSELVAERMHLQVRHVRWKVPTLVLGFPARRLSLGCYDPKLSWAAETTAGPAPDFWVGPAEWSLLLAVFGLD